MKFVATADVQLIKSVLLHPRIYPSLHDDCGPLPEEWEPTIHPQVGYVGLWDEGDLLGMAIVGKHSTVMVEIHNAILPHVGWKKRIRIGREFLEWIWGCGYKRVIGKVLASNKYALKFNDMMGMERFGINRKAFLKDGILQDEIWFGISCPESR